MAENLQFRHVVKRCANLWFVWKNRDLLESELLEFQTLRVVIKTS